MTVPYTPPISNKPAFNCPHCGAYSHQTWYTAGRMIGGSFTGTEASVHLAYCANCNDYSLWINEKLIHPSGTGPLPNADLTVEIKSDYLEARSVASISPRGAAALLRLAIEKLCVHLGAKGEDVNEYIGDLVKRGLPERIQKSLDIVRVIGGQAVHPGQIDLKDDQETVDRLFSLVNLIADAMITQPKKINELFEKLPESKREAIEKRDKKTPS